MNRFVTFTSTISHLKSPFNRSFVKELLVSQEKLKIKMILYIKI